MADLEKGPNPHKTFPTLLFLLLLLDPPYDSVAGFHDHQPNPTVLMRRDVAAGDHEYEKKVKSTSSSSSNTNTSTARPIRVSKRVVTRPITSATYKNVVSGPRNKSWSREMRRSTLSYRRFGVASKNVTHHHDITTLMIRNIPNKYTRQMLIDFLDTYCMEENRRDFATGEDDHENKTAIDFLYLPIDFRTELNKGYAFVNFTNSIAASKFSDVTNNKRWDYFQSHKVRQIAPARLQGKEELVARFEKTAFPCETEAFLPVCFSPPRDGSEESMCHRQ
ncbi:Nucleotide-binding alpha-beta plait domain containing protein [Trema orientale]|uniref:Nucleotide-binding alpha-beta plait domain containing protein n=1 Tax=Trema orientale TaxID=63057 RepID=A0A2P5FPZ6_TREOI|nr:Nucleotide-binding alpha-beta plait domain containing protein [Trema orientale]